MICNWFWTARDKVSLSLDRHSKLLITVQSATASSGIFVGTVIIFIRSSLLFIYFFNLFFITDICFKSVDALAIAPEWNYGLFNSLKV